MSKQIAAVNTAADTFQVLINRVNELIAAVNTEVMTANSSVGTATGNSFLYGIFGANTIAVDSLRGGNITTPDVLTITSNAVFNTHLTVGNSTVNVFANSTTLKLANLTSNLTITAGSLTIGNTVVSATRLFVGNSTVNAVVNSTALTFSNSTVTAVLDGSILASLGTSVLFPTATTAGTSAQIVDFFEKATYKACEYTASILDTGANNHQMSKVLVLHDTSATNAHMVEYGVIATNTMLGSFSANANSTHVKLYFTPTVSNTTIRFCKILLGV